MSLRSLLSLRSPCRRLSTNKSSFNNPKQRSTSEEDVYKFARGSIVADADLKAGTTLKCNDIWARRPGTGEIAATQYYDLLGRVLNKDISKNTQLRWNDLVD